MDAFVRRNPAVDLDIYIDDLTTNGRGATDSAVVEVCGKAADDLRTVINEERKCSIAVSKEAVVASTAELAQKVAKRIGKTTPTCERFAANLGIDYGAGRARGRRMRGTIRGARYVKGVKRRRKLDSLRRLLGPRVAAHVFTSGILPSIVYGVEVNGVSDR